MPLTLDGTNGVSAVQTGAVESGDLPAGSVIQVVQGTASTEVTTTSENTFIDSGLNASITPQSSSNKIVVVANQFFGIDGDSFFNFCYFRLLRGSTEIANYKNDADLGWGFNSGNGSRAQFAGYMPICFLDSPSTTSEITYKVQGALRDDGDNKILELNPFDGLSTMLLMEIAG